MDRFEEMRVFVRIAERQSFTQASDDLQIPRATVTNLLKRMEQRLGVKVQTSWGMTELSPVGTIAPPGAPTSNGRGAGRPRLLAPAQVFRLDGDKAGNLGLERGDYRWSVGLIFNVLRGRGRPEFRQALYGLDRGRHIEPFADLVEQVPTTSLNGPDLSDHEVAPLRVLERHIPRLEHFVG